MKRFLLGAVAAMAIAAPGTASAQSGYVDLTYGSGEYGSSDIDTLQVGGAAAWGGDGTIGFQLDGSYTQYDTDFAEDVDAFGIGGHIFTRNDSHLVGAFVGYGTTDFDVFDYGYWTVGAEGAIYLSRTTLDAAISYSDSEDLEASITALDLGVTHFFTDNFSVGAGAGFGEIDGGAEFTGWNLGTEYQFSGAPISLFAGYASTDFDGDSEYTAWNIGIRYNWGGTLLDRDRSGASLTRGGGFSRLGPLL